MTVDQQAKCHEIRWPNEKPIGGFFISAPSMQVSCSLHTPSLTAPLCSYFVSSPISAAELIAAFPFDGEFVFRLKVSAHALGMHDTDYFWLDINSKASNISNEEMARLAFNPDLLELQITPIFKSNEFVDYEVAMRDEDYSAYFEDSMAEVAYYEREPRVMFDEESRPEPAAAAAHSSKGPGLGKLLKNISKAVHKKPSVQTLPDPEEVPQDKGAGLMDLKNMKKGVTSLWKAVKTTVNSINATNNSAFTNPDVLANLQDLFNQVNLTFSNGNPQHLDLLEKLYAYSITLLNHSTYQRTTDQWKLLGFQKSDPIADVKSTGLLFLHNLLYLSKHHQAAAVSMMQRNQVNSKTNYPYAIVGVNLTLLLIEVFQVRDQKYLTSTAGYWDIFADSTAFSEVSLSFLQCVPSDALRL